MATTPIDPITGEPKQGRWLFGRFVEGWQPKAKQPKEQNLKQPRKAKAAAGDEPPAAVKLPARASKKKEIGQAVEGLNTLLLALPWTAEDALTQPEAEQLVYGLDEAQKASPRARRYILAGTEGSGLFALAVAVIGIALPRLARHGLIPGVRRISPEELAEWRRQQEAFYGLAQRQQADGAVPPDPAQPPNVHPIYSNGAG